MDFFESIKNSFRNTSGILSEYKFIHTDKENDIYDKPFDHTGTSLKFHEPRIMHYMTDWKNNSKQYDYSYSYEVLCFKDGLLVDEEDYEIRSRLGSMRIYIKESIVENNVEIFYIINRYRVYPRKYFNSPLYSSTDHQFSIPSLGIGSDREDIKDITIYKRTGNSLLFYKPVKESLINFNNSNSNYNVYIINPTNPDDRYYISNRTSYISKTYISPLPVNETYLENFGEVLDLNNMDADFLPSNFENVHDILISVNKRVLVPNVHYQVLWNKNNPRVAPVILFNGKFQNNLEINIRKQVKNFYDETCKYKYIKEIHPSGIIDLSEMEIPVNHSYFQFYLNGRRLSSSQIEYLSESVIRLKNVKSLKDFQAIMLLNRDSYTLNKIQEYRDLPSSIIENDIRSQGFEIWRNNYILDNGISDIVESDSWNFELFVEGTTDIVTDEEPAFFEYYSNINKNVNLNANILEHEGFMSNYIVNPNENLVITTVSDNVILDANSNL